MSLSNMKSLRILRCGTSLTNAIKGVTKRDTPT